MSLEASLFSSEQLATAEYVKKQALEQLAEQLATTTYPNYPKFSDRLWLTSVTYDVMNEAVLPLGKWCVDYPTMYREESEALHKTGVAFDRFGHPIHPWLDEMATDPAIGILKGKGFFRQWGPNYTADPVVLCGDEVLLIKRGDTGFWALPGGFVDKGETAEVAARREVTEETGLILYESLIGEQIYSGPVADIRLTANAWPETTAIVYRIDASDRIEPVGQDDAVAAAWVPIDIALQSPLFGSHHTLIELASS